MWRGKKFSELSTAELIEAAEFYNSVIKEISDHAPIAVWGYFRDQLCALSLYLITRPKPEPELMKKVRMIESLLPEPEPALAEKARLIVGKL
jgi:hypothetical protein